MSNDEVPDRWRAAGKGQKKEKKVDRKIELVISLIAATNFIRERPAARKRTQKNSWEGALHSGLEPLRARVDN
jgi:hypothetical protein